MSRFKIDEQSLKEVLQQSADEVGRQFQLELDGLYRMYAGKPPEEVKRQVREAFRRIDVKASDSEITDYATRISEGSKIRVNVEQIR